MSSSNVCSWVMACSAGASAAAPSASSLFAAIPTPPNTHHPCTHQLLLHSAIDTLSTHITQHTLHPSPPFIQPTHHSPPRSRCCSWVMACSAGGSAAAPLAPSLFAAIPTPPNTHHNTHMIHTHHAPISCCSTQPSIRFQHTAHATPIAAIHSTNTPLTCDVQVLQLGHGLQCWCQCCCAFSSDTALCHPTPTRQASAYPHDTHTPCTHQLLLHSAIATLPAHSTRYTHRRHSFNQHTTHIQGPGAAAGSWLAVLVPVLLRL